MPDHPMDNANSLVVRISEFGGHLATGIERDTGAIVRFVPATDTAERIRQAQAEDRGIVVGMEKDSPAVLSVDPA